jgi:nitrogen fixation-related uncharacterized protein
MFDLIPVAILLVAVLILDFAANRWGCDTRDGFTVSRR